MIPLCAFEMHLLAEWMNRIFLIGRGMDHMIQLFPEPGVKRRLIFRRMSPSAWDAPSAISSSDKIEEAIFSSRYLLGVKASKRQSIEVSSPSERFSPLGKAAHNP